MMVVLPKQLSGGKFTKTKVDRYVLTIEMLHQLKIWLDFNLEGVKFVL
jgi:hypothetical protein